jgi:hypothetical protein
MNKVKTIHETPLMKLAHQPFNTIDAYSDYLEAKIELGEVPMTFEQWAEFEQQPQQETKLYFIYDSWNGKKHMIPTDSKFS